MNKELNSLFPKEDIQMANNYMERCSNITYHKGNENWKHNEITSHLLEWLSSRKQEITRDKYFWGCGEKNSCAPLMGLETSPFTMEDSMKVPPKKKKRIIIWSSDPTSRNVSKENENRLLNSH